MGLLADFFAGALTGANQGYDYVKEHQRQQALDDLERQRVTQGMNIQQNQENRAADDFQRNRTAQTVAELRQRGQHLMQDGRYQDAAGQLPALSQALTKMGMPGVAPVVGEPTGYDTAYPQGPTPGGDALPPTSVPRPNNFNNEKTVGALTAALNYEPEKPMVAPGGSVVLNHDGTKIVQNIPYQENPNLTYAADQRVASAAATAAAATARARTTQDRIDQRQQNALSFKAPPKNWDGYTALNRDPAMATKAEQYATKYGLRPSLFKGLLFQESGFNPRAVSPVGAQGLGQLMPGTAKDLGVTDPFNVDQNLDASARYLAQQMQAFGGDERKALAAYNAGPGAVQKYGDVPPYAETQGYVDNVLQHAHNFEYAPAAHARTDADLRAQAGFGVTKPGQYATPEERAAYNAAITRRYNQLKQQQGAGAAPAPSAAPAVNSPLAAWAQQQLTQKKGAQPPARPAQGAQ